MEKGLIDSSKKIQLEMLMEFVKICDRHNLQYFMLGGSCLGAVRHKGFIPWDDDIDVGMPREDYEKFIEIATKEVPEHMFVQTHESDPEYLLDFAKLRNSNTTFIESAVQKWKINHGIYIDIFPLDGFTENKLSRFIFLKKKMLYFVAMGKHFYFGEESNKIKRSYKNRILHFVVGIYSDLEKTYAKRKKLYCKYSYERANIIANHNGAWGEREIVPKSYFGNGTKGIFENIEVTLPENYDGYLSALYGDYMTPPPPEKQVGHHNYVVLDTERSYRYYVSEE